LFNGGERLFPKGRPAEQALRRIQNSEVIPLMNLRLILWTLCMAYVGFLLANTNGASPLNVAIAAFIGALIGFALGIMFGNRAHRKAHHT